MYEKYVNLSAEYDFDDFCKLLFTELKDADNLTWNDVRDIVNYIYGVNYTTSCYKSKKARYLANCYKDLIDASTDEEENELDKKLLEIAKQKYKLSEERIQINALVRKLSREETLKEIARDIACHMSSVKQLSYNPVKGFDSTNDKVGLVLISDWHYGVTIQNEFNIYNTKVAVDRINELMGKVIDICTENKIHDVVVANLGDMVAGNIHLPLRLNSRIDVITQVIKTSELLAEFLNSISEVTNVSYLSVIDNHSRIEPNKSDSLELENLSRITDWYLRDRLENKVIFLDDTVKDIVNINVLGHEVVFVHGHKDKPENLTKSLNSFCKKHIDLICSAHYHHFRTDESCETVLLSNGSLMGTDDYAYNLRVNSKPSQTFIEITPTNVISCIRKIDLNS